MLQLGTPCLPERLRGVPYGSPQSGYREKGTAGAVVSAAARHRKDDPRAPRRDVARAQGRRARTARDPADGRAEPGTRSTRALAAHEEALATLAGAPGARRSLPDRLCQRREIGVPAERLSSVARSPCRDGSCDARGRARQLQLEPCPHLVVDGRVSRRRSTIGSSTRCRHRCFSRRPTICATRCPCRS